MGAGFLARAMGDETEHMAAPAAPAVMLTIACPECGARVAPIGGKVDCGACGFTSAKEEKKDSEDALAVVEAFPLEGEGRVLLGLRSGVQVAYRVTRSSLVAEGQAAAAEVSSRRLKVLPRTGGKWIVFDGMQPLARGDVQVCKTLHAACVALGAWVLREKAGTVPMRDPVPAPAPIFRPRTMSQVARMQELRVQPVATKAAAASNADSKASKVRKGSADAAAAPKKSGRKWPGCGHRRFAGEESCRYCVAQVTIDGVAGTKAIPNP